jgi:hypothetical protein
VSTALFQRGAALCAALAFAIGALASTAVARAADIDLGGGRLRATGAVTFGAMERTEDRDPGLINAANAAALGIRGNAPNGKNGDDGNLNFARGDVVSMPLKGYLTLDYSRDALGALVSAKAWWDVKLERFGAPWGNIPNDLTAGAVLGTSGARPRAEWSGILVDNAYVYGSGTLGGAPVDFKAGYQKLDWGNRFVVLGGLRDLVAIDLPATLRPGAIAVDETRIAAPLLFAGVRPAPDWRVEGFWQVHAESSVPNQCGSFFALNDAFAEGCDKVLLGAANDRVSLATGNYIKRAATVDASGADEGGVAVKYDLAAWSTQFGAYATQFHSRTAYWSVIKSQRAGPAPFVPGDPDGLNPEYFFGFPEAIHMVALTFDTKWTGGSVFGELSYRPNQPLQYNASDAVAVAISNTLPTPLRAAYAQVAPGGTFTGYERHKNVQLQLAAQQGFPNVLRANVLEAAVEFVYKGVPDLPDPSVARFGRSDTFGSGPVNGACVSPSPIACTEDGYVSRHAFGVRTRFALRYLNVIDGVDLIPSLAWGKDLKGWSGDGAINEGRNIGILALRAQLRGGWSGEIAWWPTWGGAYDTGRDRSSAQASVAWRF